MSCGNRIKQAAEAAMRAGVTAMTSKKTFYVGATATGVLMSGLALRKFMRSRPTLPAGTARTAPPLTSLPESSVPKIQTLPGLKRITPTPREKLAGQHCQGCNVDPESKPGPWYTIRGATFCQECARPQAQKAGMEIASPPPAVASSIAKSSSGYAAGHLIGHRVNLKPGWVNTGPLKNVEGYIVLDGRSGKPTGLVLAPEVKMGPAGQPSVNTTRWYINYDRINKAVGGPYESINQAKTVAALLANFDWNRSMEEFSKEEVQIIQRALVEYRADIEEAKIIKEQAAMFMAK